MGYDPKMFIDGCYGGTGILYVDGVYGNYMPDAPQIYIEKPRHRYTYLCNLEFLTLFKKIKYIRGDIPRVIIWTTIETNTKNTDRVEFYLDGRHLRTDFRAPFDWKLRPPLGIHTVEAYAYDRAGNMSKAITDIFVLR